MSTAPRNPDSEEQYQPDDFVVDVSGFSRHLNHRDAPIWWGIIGLILIELSVVSAFSISYLYLQMMNPTWPPSGKPPEPLLIPTINLGLLSVSCVTMYLAGKAINKNRIRLFVIYTFISVFLASMVLLLRWQQYQNFAFDWNDHVYGSLLWTISGFHFTHVVSAILGTAAIGCFGLTGFFTRKRQIGVVVDTLYWNFVAVAWIPFYFMLYIMPRLV